MAVGNALCFLAFSHQHQHNFSLQSHRLLFLHTTAEVRGENMPERKFASTRDQTHNHQVMSPTRSPQSHPGGATEEREKVLVIPKPCTTESINFADNQLTFTQNI